MIDTRPVNRHHVAAWIGGVLTGLVALDTTAVQGHDHLDPAKGKTMGAAEMHRVDVLTTLALAEQGKLIGCDYRRVVLPCDGDAVTEMVSMTMSQEHRVDVPQVVRADVGQWIARQKRVDNEATPVSGNLKARMTVKYYRSHD